MTAATADLQPRDALPPSLQRLLSPAEGWTALLLTALMAATVALSLDDAAWVLGDPDYGDFLVWMSLAATLVGFAGAMTGWPRWIVHFIGAVIAAFVVPVAVGSILIPDGSPQAMFNATATAVTNAWYDLAVLERVVTPQIGHYLLALGLIVWSVGQFAAYAVFGHRRPLDAVIVVGIILLANMALTIHDQLFLLVLFSLAALFLLARAHALEEQAIWLRRRIGDATSVRSLYLRGGTAFVVIAVVGSLALTASASSAPLAGAWAGFGDRLLEVSQSLQRYLPFGGAPRSVGFGFGNTAPISGSWTSDSSPVATIHVPPGVTQRYYWRAVTYDSFQGTAWAWTSARDVARPRGEPALTSEADNPASLGLRSELKFNVEPVAGRSGYYVLSPQDAVSVDEDSRLWLVGAGGYFSALQLSNSSRPYQVTALLPVERDAPGGRTQNRLRAAGVAYPAEVEQLYLQVPDGAIGPEATKLLREILAKAPSTSPYDIAFTMQQELRKIRYNQNVVGRCPPGMSVVECFATIREGYCQYYASTMAIFLRQQGIPARMVQGFLPGSRDAATGEETVLLNQAHAWVEVYFPGYGWQLFDPTGGGLPRTSPLPVGGPVPSTTPAPSADGSGNVLPSRRADERDPDPGGAGTTTPVERGGPGLLIAVAVLLLVGVGGIAFIAWQRGPRDISPEGVWRGVGRTAGRFGFGARPTQTVYEYAGALGDVLPTARPALETVARAKVEVTYGHRELGSDGLTALREAHRRLRVTLLRLALLREERRRRRRRGV